MKLYGCHGIKPEGWLEELILLEWKYVRKESHEAAAPNSKQFLRYSVFLERGHNFKPMNYRPIALLRIVSKVLKSLANTQLLSKQAVFARTRCSVQSRIWTMRRTAPSRTEVTDLTAQTTQPG